MGCRQLSKCDPKGTRGQGFKDSSEMLKNYKSNAFVCVLERQVLFAGDLDLIENGELGTLKRSSHKSKEC